SPSLENLTFIGDESIFEVKDGLMPSFISSTSLRYLALKGGIAFELTSSLLLALHAPNLEKVHIAEPCLRINGVGWEEITYQMEERFLRRKDTFGKVHSLVFDPWPDYDDDEDPREDMHFFRFLMLAFPNITSLELDQKDVCVLSICNGKHGLPPPGWAFIDRLTIHDNPAHHALKHVLAFAHFRNSNCNNYVEEDQEESEDDDTSEESDDDVGNEDHDTAQEGDDDIGNQDHETGEDQDSEYQDEAQSIQTWPLKRYEDMYRSAKRQGKRKANEAIMAGVEEKGDFDCTPIETIVIKGRGKRKVKVDKIISLLRKKVRSVQVLEALGPV
ncbi:hypothetical protein FS837_005318, partial [Tulasnella sp. UAMH 9824]